MKVVNSFNTIPHSNSSFFFNLSLNKLSVHKTIHVMSFRCQNTKYEISACQLRVNRADKNNRTGLEMTSNTSSISAILASLFEHEFSLQLYMELTVYLSQWRTFGEILGVRISVTNITLLNKKVIKRSCLKNIS